MNYVIFTLIRKSYWVFFRFMDFIFKLLDSLLDIWLEIVEIYLPKI